VIRTLFTLVLILIAVSGYGQFRGKKNLRFSFANYFSSSRADYAKTSKKSLIYPATFASDRLENNHLRTPLLLASASSSYYSGDLYWMSSVTTQSYNQGKVGTYYYWDLQGNLRESRFFFDIAGKNKRGLKLVFPRRR
jgi:hypothetical protein